MKHTTQDECQRPIEIKCWRTQSNERTRQPARKKYSLLPQFMPLSDPKNMIRAIVPTKGKSDKAIQFKNSEDHDRHGRKPPPTCYGSGRCIENPGTIKMQAAAPVWPGCARLGAPTLP